MNKLKIILGLLITMLGHIALAQEYKAQLLDLETKEPIEYGNVGIIDGEIGLNTDSAGYFTINIPDSLSGKKILFSLIGYKDNRIAVKDFTDMVRAGKDKIYLEKEKEMLQEVVIRPAKYVQDILGNDITCLADSGAKKQLPMPFLFERKKKKEVVSIDTLTEIGTLMKVKKHKTFIDSVQINVGRCTYPEILYRLNVYEDIDGEYKNILREPIYIRMKQENVGNKIIIDMTPYSLVVHHDFVVAVERVKDLGKGEFSICGNISMAAPMLMRVTSLGQGFVKLPIIGMGMQAYVTMER